MRHFLQTARRTIIRRRFVIEYNGMWKLEDLLQLKYPRKWQIQGIYSTVNGTTLDMYLKNMRNMLMERLPESELIIINRCPEGVDRSGFKTCTEGTESNGSKSDI